MQQVSKVWECSTYPKREVDAYNLPVAIHPVGDRHRGPTTPR